MSTQPTTDTSRRDRQAEPTPSRRTRSGSDDPMGELYRDFADRELVGIGSEVPATASEPKTHAIQVEPEHYGRSYFDIPRMIGYLYQADAVHRCGGHKVLEIGVGTGLTSYMLRLWGYDLQTLDLDGRLGPTCVGDATRMPFQDDAFDTVLIAEMLEHLPFEEFVPALRELRRVSRKHVVVTLPAPLVGASLGINICGIYPKFLSFGARQWTRPVFDGQHYWELGRRGYPKRRIQQAMRDAGFEIINEFRQPFSLYCHFFILRKI